MLNHFYKKFPYEEVWYHYLTGEWRVQPPAWFRAFTALEQFAFQFLPSDPHCIECKMPMAGPGGALLRFYGSTPSSFSSRLCSACERFVRKKESGAEVELSMLFADVRAWLPQLKRERSSSVNRRQNTRGSRPKDGSGANWNSRASGEKFLSVSSRYEPEPEVKIVYRE